MIAKFAPLAETMSTSQSNMATVPCNAYVMWSRSKASTTSAALVAIAGNGDQASQYAPIRTYLVQHVTGPASTRIGWCGSLRRGLNSVFNNGRKSGGAGETSAVQ